MLITENDIKFLQIQGLTVGVTSGCFDLLHFYHLRYLERCKAMCDFLIVGVDSDQLVFENKKKHPIIPEHHRMAMVDALKCVDATFRMDTVNDNEKFYPVATKVFKNGSTIYGNKVVVPDGIELVIVPDIEEVFSTTELINKIRSK